jgi:DNA polymerase (family 10)
MSNKEIANFLYQIAEMLEIIGDSRFRVVAYEKAAHVIENLGKDVTDIYQAKGLSGLTEISGIGQSIAEKIIEKITLGKSKYYQELAKKVPRQELNLIKIPGIGPKTAQKLYQAFKIKNLTDLEKIARLGKISRLSGFDVITEKNILENIKRLKKREKRLLISFAEPIAEECLNTLKKSLFVNKCDAVGSLRRMKETIGDIDLVVASQKPQQVINFFIKQPFVKKIKAKGLTKVSIFHKAGVSIDLEILPSENYGSLLQHLTGSKDHNVHLRKYANSKGLSLSEYGIKVSKTRKIEHFSNEKDFYQRLELQYIPPELREDRGEIEKAQTGKLPNLIKLSNIKGDLHLHTDWSEGDVTIEEMIRACILKGYEYIAITDHTKGLGIASGMDEKTILKQVKTIRNLNKKFKKIKIFCGVEVNIKADGSLDISDEVLARLDLVLASVHSSFRQSEAVMTSRIIKAINNPFVRIIGHPSGRLLKKRESYDVDWEQIFKESAKNKVALEINSFPERLDLKDTLVQKAKSKGIKFSINTDAHSPYHLDKIRYGVSVARRGWAEKKDIINAWSKDKLINWLKK